MNGQNNPLVLVADDEDHFRRSQVEALKFFGYDVEEARNGNELYAKAESLINTGKVFVLTVDNQMPEGFGENEREKQWCGFERILKLCKQYPKSELEERVLFLSRWELEDLPENYKKDARQYGLLQADHWLHVYTPFSVLKARIERILNPGS